MKVLVTGCAGFIGFHLSNLLLKNKINVYGIDNLNDYYDVELKKNRLNILKKNKKFIFYKSDLINKSKLNQIVKNKKAREQVDPLLKISASYFYKTLNDFELVNSKFFNQDAIKTYLEEYQADHYRKDINKVISLHNTSNFSNTIAIASSSKN